MSNTDRGLADKVILITGAAQGIGGAAAQLCAERGAQVIITDINIEKGEALAKAIREGGGQAACYGLDVRDQAAVGRVFEQVAKTYGRLDVLICAAGILAGPGLQPDEFPIETFEFVMDVNVKGMFLCVKYAMPLFEADRRGVIILVGSGAGVVGGSSSIAYGASKGAVNGLGMTLERHLARRGIRVNVICPGGINTELKLGQMRALADYQGEAFDADEAAQSLGSPSGVAKVLAFLASDEADYIRRNLFTR